MITIPHQISKANLIAHAPYGACLSAYVNPDGHQEWYKEGKIHRVDDLPAVINSEGSKFWYKNGERHRDDNPATILSNGSKRWYKDGKLYRAE